MLTAAAFAMGTAILAFLIPSTDAHGYVLVPPCKFKGSETSAWVVQIDPAWQSDNWNGNSEKSVETFKSLKAANGFRDLKTLMDDTSVYGPDCGFTDPNGPPQPIPQDGKVTFSRALLHRGPCGIALDDKMVFYEEDCYSKYGSKDKNDKSVFPVDFSSCNNGGCKMLRFYWLAFQGVKDKTKWQSYKNCIPLAGSGGGNNGGNNGRPMGPKQPGPEHSGRKDPKRQNVDVPMSPSTGGSPPPTNAPIVVSAPSPAPTSKGIRRFR